MQRDCDLNKTLLVHYFVHSLHLSLKQLFRQLPLDYDKSISATLFLVGTVECEPPDQPACYLPMESGIGSMNRNMNVPEPVVDVKA